MDVDASRHYVFTSNHDDIKLHRYFPATSEGADGADGETFDLAYINRIPVVKTWDAQVVKPDNLLLYGGGERILLSDAQSYDAILNLNIERGIVTGKNPVHKSFGSAGDVGFKVNKFDYNVQGEYAQFDKCAIGVNSNHLMRFDVTSGTVVHHKAYERNPGFTCVATDERGTIVVGDREGGLRVFADVGKRAVKAIPGLGDPITHVQVSPGGDVLATTDLYFVLLPRFMYMEGKGLHISKLPMELARYLRVEGCKIVKAQFSADGKSAIFSTGKYILHQELEHVVTGVSEYRVYEADGKILCHKRLGAGQFALSETKPVHFQL
jgi:hypothetical protein